jgi:hypothetical protein
MAADFMTAAGLASDEVMGTASVADVALVAEASTAEAAAVVFMAAAVEVLEAEATVVSEEDTGNLIAAIKTMASGARDAPRFFCSQRAGFELHRREVLRLRVPALRAKAKARDTPLRMTERPSRA